MRWSTRLGTVLGIPVRLHWSMLLLLLFVSWGSGVVGVFASLVGLVLLFGSVLAHELAHAMAARGFRIGTSEILLLPIGGLAKIEREPQTGRQEVVIALAGPLASLAIAALAGAVSLSLPGAAGPLHAVASTLLWSNLMLGLFNLLPAFPLDGGRILRGALRERRGLLEATRTAAKVGRVVAVPMGLAGLFFASPSLVLIALFIWFAARGEQRLLEARAAWRAVPASPRADDPWAGWRSPSPWPPGATRPFGPTYPTPAARPRRYVIQAGPFGYVIREIG